MRRVNKWIVFFIGLLGWQSVAFSAGLLTPSDGRFPALALAEHHVDVVVEDGYAITTVDQIFHNPHPQDLEAHYSFPLPDQAAVGQLTVWIDGQPVIGEVVEKQRARQIYEEQVAQGKTAGITEQNSYHTFETQIAPILAGQHTKVRIQYFQPATLDHGIGRYLYPLEDGGVDEQALAFWDSDSHVTQAFSFTLLIRSAYPVQGVRVPKYPQAVVKQLGSGDWQIAISNQQQGAGVVTDSAEREAEALAAEYQATRGAQSPLASVLDSDIVVYWKMQEGLPGSLDLITHKPDADRAGTFMLTFTPGDDLAVLDTGIDWVFVLDQSGSMQGKYATLVDGVERALRKLRAQDRFQIVLFNNNAVRLTTGWQQVGLPQITQSLEQVRNTHPGGGTNLFAGLKLALNGLDADRPTGIVLVTDGVANVGETDQQAFLNLVKKQDVRLFTFVMGNSANRPLLTAMAKHSGGFAMQVSNNDDIVGLLMQASSKITHQAFRDVAVNFDGLRVDEITPQTLRTIYRGEQLVVMGHYRGHGPVRVQLTGKIAGQERRYETRIELPEVSRLNPEIERLWAYAMIQDLHEQMRDFASNDHRQAITDIALQYGLVTEYTSMLVLRDEEYERYQIQRRNKDRVSTEQQAQQQRRLQAVRDHRADSAQPMFNQPRADVSKGGSVDFLLLVSLFGLALSRRKSVFNEVK